MYVAHHMTADSTKFGGDGVIKYVLFYISDAYCIVYYNYSFSADYLCALYASLDKHKKNS
jgi:putative membrane protein